MRYLAVIMGRSESTIHYWLQLYKTGGLSKLLEEPPQTGRPKVTAHRNRVVLLRTDKGRSLGTESIF